jgi:hypothetical protein
MGGDDASKEPSNLFRAELVQCDVMKLHNINVQSLNFQAQVWLEFRIPKGAKDPHLSQKGAVFPIDESGKPTFRPSAEWYFHQVDFRNATTFTLVDRKLRDQGDDIMVACRYNGTFTEIYELEDFPFDQQGLTIQFNLNCRVGGPLPVDLSVSAQCKVTLSCIDTCPPAREWAVADRVHFRTHNLGAEYKSDRVFPALNITARVSRRPLYHVLNLAVPMGLFSLLSLFQGLTEDEEASINHRAQLTLMMVLTASAYKMAIANKMPPVSYLTWLDKYTLGNFFLIIAMALQSRTLSQLGEGKPRSAEEYDQICIWMFAACWVLIHVWFITKAMKLQLLQSRKQRDSNIQKAIAKGRYTIKAANVADVVLEENSMVAEPRL